MKRILYILAFLPFSVNAQISLDTITTVNIGVTAGDGTGDTVRTAFRKVNTSLTNLQSNDSVLRTAILTGGTDFDIIRDSVADQIIDSIASRLLEVDSIVFNGTNGANWLKWRLGVDTTEHFLTFDMEEDGVRLQIGGEFYVYCRDNTGVGISNGTFVRFDGVTGEIPDINIAGCGSLDSSLLIGATTHDFEPNGFGFVTTRGKVNGVDRQGYTPGLVEYLWHNGQATQSAPTFPNIAVITGTTLRANVNGILYMERRETVWNIPQHSIYFSGVNRQRSADSSFIYNDTEDSLHVSKAGIDTIQATIYTDGTNNYPLSELVGGGSVQDSIGADSVNINDIGNYYTSTNVEGALQQVPSIISVIVKDTADVLRAELSGSSLTAEQIMDSIHAEATFTTTVQYDSTLIDYGTKVLTGDVTVLVDSTNAKNGYTWMMASYSQDSLSGLVLTNLEQEAGSLDYDTTKINLILGMWHSNPGSTGARYNIYAQYNIPVVDTVTAVLSSSEAGNVTDSTVVMTFSKDIKDITMPASSSINIKEGGVSVGITSITLTASNQVSIVCDSIFEVDSNITISYTKPVSNPFLTNSNDQEVNSWADSTVINNVTGVAIPTDNILAYWEFDNDLTDNSGNGYTLTGSSETYTAGKDGDPNGAINFNGSAYAYLSGNDLNEARSYSLWFNYSMVSGAGIMFSNSDFSSTSNGIGFVCDVSNTRLRSYYADGSAPLFYDVTNSNDYNDGAWHHLALIIDITGDSVSIFVDGVFEASSILDGIITTPAYYFYIGDLDQAVPVQYPYTGYMDKFRIYTDVLTKEEIKALSDE